MRDVRPGAGRSPAVDEVDRRAATPPPPRPGPAANSARCGTCAASRPLSPWLRLYRAPRGRSIGGGPGASRIPAGITAGFRPEFQLRRREPRAAGTGPWRAPTASSRPMSQRLAMPSRHVQSPRVASARGAGVVRLCSQGGRGRGPGGGGRGAKRSHFGPSGGAKRSHFGPSVRKTKPKMGEMGKVWGGMGDGARGLGDGDVRRTNPTGDPAPGRAERTHRSDSFRRMVAVVGSGRGA